MVYPRLSSARSFAKFVAVCAAIHLCVVGSVADAKTPDNDCKLTVSPGDANVGIRIVGDNACASGGLGCINNNCRFCKAKDTDQSKHLMACPAVIVVPNPAPAPTPAPTCSVSGGDRAVGIQAVADKTCSSGGLGCYSSTCRFCMYKSTDKSSHLVSCSSRTTPATTTTTTTTATTVAVGPWSLCQCQLQPTTPATTTTTTTTMVAR
ncbi:TPA: hypothetical protein N0F65_010756 [Lagenidium giganteum]|uniref:Uncharacterized protein n=1 Tax=Lagenidium giganteum TaxID=4803 RepID=A0AAV2YUX7_9STRA|nr:TPA: hypothetical protein N0F65_010756 [Lagenidium giganteum]